MNVFLNLVLFFIIQISFSTEIILKFFKIFIVGYPVVNDPLYNHEVFGPSKGKGGDIGGKTDEELVRDLINIHNAENWLGIDGDSELSLFKPMKAESEDSIGGLSIKGEFNSIFFFVKLSVLNNIFCYGLYVLYKIISILQLMYWHFICNNLKNLETQFFDLIYFVISLPNQFLLIMHIKS